MMEYKLWSQLTGRPGDGGIDGEGPCELLKQYELGVLDTGFSGERRKL